MTVRNQVLQQILLHAPRLPAAHLADRIDACGDDLGTLYITTSWENLERGEDPLAGALFAVRPGVTGLPARPFAG